VPTFLKTAVNNVRYLAHPWSAVYSAQLQLQVQEPLREPHDLRCALRTKEDSRRSILGQPSSPLGSIGITFLQVRDGVDDCRRLHFVLSVEERVKEGFGGEFSLLCCNSFPVSSWKFHLCRSLDNSAYAVAFFSCSVLSISFLLCMLNALLSRTAKSNQATNLVMYLCFSSRLRTCFHSFHRSSSFSRTFSYYNSNFIPNDLFPLFTLPKLTHNPSETRSQTPCNV